MQLSLSQKKVKVAGVVEENPHAYHAAASAAAVLHLFALDARQVDPRRPL